MISLVCSLPCHRKLIKFTLYDYKGCPIQCLSGGFYHILVQIFIKVFVPINAVFSLEEFIFHCNITSMKVENFVCFFTTVEQCLEHVK